MLRAGALLRGLCCPRAALHLHVAPPAPTRRRTARVPHGQRGGACVRAQDTDRNLAAAPTLACRVCPSPAYLGPAPSYAMSKCPARPRRPRERGSDQHRPQAQGRRSLACPQSSQKQNSQRVRSHQPAASQPASRAAASSCSPLACCRCRYGSGPGSRRSCTECERCCQCAGGGVAYSSVSASCWRAFLAIVWKASSMLIASLADVSK